MAFDNRQIQTAVLDRADSDEPVVCPTELDELLAFREEHAGHRFFCGELLGGCGFELGTRRGVSRVCHFYHLANPDRPACGRREKTAGVASADHLYILKSTKSWLRGQGRDPKYRFSEHDDTAPPGALVDITSEGLNLRFHSDPALPLAWGGEARTELVLGPNVRVDSATLRCRGYVNRFMMRSEGSKRVLLFCTVFPDSGVSEWYPVEQCEITPRGRLMTPALKGFVPPAPQPEDTAHVAADVTEDAGEQVQIGDLVRYLTEGMRVGEVRVVRGLLWQAEAEKPRCESLALEKLQAAITRAQKWLSERDKHRAEVFRHLRDAVASRQGDAVDKSLRQAREAVSLGEAATEEEAALLKEAEPIVDSWRSRPLHRGPSPWIPAWISPTPAKRPAPEPPALKPAPKDVPETPETKRARRTARAEITALLARLDADASAMSATELDTVLADLERAEAAAGSISTRQRRHVAHWKNSRAATEKAGTLISGQSTTGLSGPPARLGAQLPPDKLDSAAAAVRGALKRTARDRGTTSWSRLSQQLGSAMPRMTPAERLEVLIRADQATPADQPLLAALVAAGDLVMASRYRSVAAAHGRDIPTDEPGLRSAIASEVRRLHELWCYQ
jgi:hypothetical protein